jgi:hypothetical protein
MIRLAGTRLVAAVLIGADKWDESLGVTRTRMGSRETARDGREDNDTGSSDSLGDVSKGNLRARPPDFPQLGQAGA